MRRQPIASPKNSAAPSVTASGTLCRMALALAIGMLKSAVRKQNVPAISPTLRRTISRTSPPRGR